MKFKNMHKNADNSQTEDFEDEVERDETEAEANTDGQDSDYDDESTEVEIYGADPDVDLNQDTDADEEDGGDDLEDFDTDLDSEEEFEDDMGTEDEEMELAFQLVDTLRKIFQTTNKEMDDEEAFDSAVRESAKTHGFSEKELRKAIFEAYASQSDDVVSYSNKQAKGKAEPAKDTGKTTKAGKTLKAKAPDVPACVQDIADVLDHLDKVIKTTAPNRTTNYQGLKKTEAVKAIHAQLSEMSEAQLYNLFTVLHGADERMEALEETFSDGKQETKQIFEGVEGADAEFVERASTVVEAAVRKRTEDIVSALEVKYEKSLDEKVQAFREEMIESIDKFLDDEAAEFFEENRVALETGLKNDITENFLSGLHNLFEENYVEVPKGKANLVERLKEDVATTESKLKETLRKGRKWRDVALKTKRELVINQLSEGLSKNQQAQLRKQLDGVDYINEKSFRNRAKTLKEAFVFKDSPKKSSSQIVETLVETTDSDPSDKPKSSNPYAEAAAMQIRSQKL